VDSGASISSGAEQDVYGSGSGDAVYDGGLQVIASDGTATSITISSGGSETVLAGGAASATTLISSSGTDISATIDDGGSQTIEAGGAAICAEPGCRRNE
jgi:autotransporter passenger strand-loop-strand repeat protein